MEAFEELSAQIMRLLQAQINALELDRPLTANEVHDCEQRRSGFEGWEIITLKREVEREYTIPEPQTTQEVIGYYARRLAEAVKFCGDSAKGPRFFRAKGIRTEC